MTNQLPLPGLASPAARLAEALAIYGPLYGADPDTARVGVETMAGVYGSIDAALAELQRRAAQARDSLDTEQDRTRTHEQATR